MASGSRRPRCTASSAGTAGHSEKSAHASEQGRADVAAVRIVWFEAQPDLDPERLIFIDETGLNTKMARLRGPRPEAISWVDPNCSAEARYRVRAWRAEGPSLLSPEVVPPGR